MAFDEALEILGIKFAKQNMSMNVKDSEHLMELLKSVQIERERMMMLYDEFVDDNNSPVSRNPRAVNDHKQALWKLANEILEAFNNVSPERSALFEKTTQFNKRGLSAFI